MFDAENSYYEVSGEVKRDSSYRKENMERLRDVCVQSTNRLIDILLQFGSLHIDLGNRNYSGLAPKIMQTIVKKTDKRVILRLTNTTLDDSYDTAILDAEDNSIIFTDTVKMQDVATLIDFAEKIFI